MSTIQKNQFVNPDIIQNPMLSQWISIDRDGKILLRAGKVELGQGIGIVQLQIAAEELDVPVDAIRMVAGHTGVSVDLGYTSGSNSVQIGAMALRQICAHVRQLFIEAASKVFNTPSDEITLRNGVFSTDQTKTRLTYLDLASRVDLNTAVSNAVKTKNHLAYKISGQSIKRPDLNKKLFDYQEIKKL